MQTNTRKVPTYAGHQRKRTHGILMGCLLLALLGSAGKADVSSTPELVLLQWNVENFFDWEDDPDNEGDDEFTPGS